jgi:hypothetical protein
MTVKARPPRPERFGPDLGPRVDDRAAQHDGTRSRLVPPERFVEIPHNYTRSSNWWWRMDLQLNLPHDRTTWEARVIRNPLRSVSNS